MSSSSLKMAERTRYRIWFNTSNIYAFDQNWTNNVMPTRDYTIEEIRNRSKYHTVTHVILWQNIPPNIHTLFPNLKNLWLVFMWGDLDLYSISKLRNLQVLNLSGNRLSVKLLDAVFTSLQSLRALNISYCGLSALPNSIAGLKNLQVLNMEGINLNNILPDDMFTSLQSLRELNISYCGLHNLPKSICLLPDLQVLNISGNNQLYANQLDDMFTSLVSLEKLCINNCRLSTLPKSVRSLQELQSLEIYGNDLVRLPSFLYTLGSLQTLDLSYNKFLKSLDPEILQLTQLQTLNLHCCDALTSPPSEVCQRGVVAVIQYYIDLAKGSGKNLPFATIAVLGNTMAGKTSLIKTLQNAGRKRVLTKRSPAAAVDETTKVFNVEEVVVEGTVLRVIDMGGQEVYHITYQLTLKQNCIPVIVVNMVQFDELAKESTSREAVRRLAFDYMSHLYLANPTLGAPKLIFTHKDKFQSVKFQQLRSSFLELTNQICAEIVKEEKSIGGQFCQIQHFITSADEVFHKADIYEVGKDDEYEVFDLIKESLLRRSQHFVKPLPMVWEKVNEKILSLPSACKSFWSVLALLRMQSLQIKPSQLDIILTYMHDCGKILWYKDIEVLRPCIFHKISEVTKLLTILYHHDSSIWRNRCDDFVPRRFDYDTFLDKQEFEDIVKHYTSTGVMPRNLLVYLIEKETSFTGAQNVEIASCLLQTFRLLHGPLRNQANQLLYILPQFATDYFDISYLPPKRLLLQTVIMFSSLALPQYVYLQMTVGLLELFPDDIAAIKVKRNGANVYQDGIYTQLVHDYKSRKVLIFVSSDTAIISQMWKRLISATNNIIRHVLETWTASRPITSIHCAHCLMLGKPHPRKIVNPPWCLRSLKHSPPPVKFYKGSSTTLCDGDEIPSALLYPCDVLSESETDNLEKSIAEMAARKEQLLLTTSTAADKVNADDSLSDLSDEDEYLYPGGEKREHLKLIRLKLEKTTSPKIRKLFSNTDKVFSMTRKRGRALIINNKNFDKRPDLCRKGSDVDVENMSAVLKGLKFEVVTHTDLKAETILSTIKDEVQLKEHEDLGCHVLVIMTHGSMNNYLYGTDLKRLSLTDVYDLLTFLNFPGMCGKPKIVILEACSGGKKFSR